MLFADGGDIEMISIGKNNGELSTKEELEEFAETLDASLDAHAAEVHGDSLDELLQKVPMLQKFNYVKDILKGLFNLNVL